MTWVHCVECPNVQECAEADGCEIERKKAAEEAAAERRKLLAGVDRGITEIAGRLSRFLAMNDIDIEKVDMVLMAKDAETEFKLQRIFKEDPRLEDLMRWHGVPMDFRAGFLFMALRMRIGLWPTNS